MINDDKILTKISSFSKNDIFKKIQKIKINNKMLQITYFKHTKCYSFPIKNITINLR